MPENGGNNSGLPDPFDHRPAPFSLQPWAMNSPADTPLGRGPRGPAPRKPAASSGWSDCEKHTSGTRTAAPSITHGSSLQASKIGLPPVALSKALRVAPPRMELVSTRPTRFRGASAPVFSGLHGWFAAGWEISASRRSLSSRAARGRTATTRASTVRSETSY